MAEVPAVTPSATTTLRSFGGREAPPELGDDLRRVSLLPPEALLRFWQVLSPSLAEPIARETEELLDLFCTAYGVPEDDLARAIKACRFLIREASRLDVQAAHLGEDLDRLCPDEPLLKEILLAGYGPAKAAIRHAVLHAALADHGKLLIRAQWRLDTVQSSEGGKKLGLPVAMLTLHYREGNEAGRITLQVLPDMMGELKGICDEVLA